MTALVAYTKATTIKLNDSSLEPSNPEDDTNYEIVYPEGEEGNIDIDPSNYPESFGWGVGFLCSATMISPRVAITAAHCIPDGWDGTNPTDDSGDAIEVTLTNSDPNKADFTTTIQEIRTSECWHENKFTFIADGDLAMLILTAEKTDAQLGTDYIDIWDEATDGTITGETFALMGWGYSGPVSNPEQGFNDFHRGYNVVTAVNGNIL